jgi:uncharacterized protein Smg (DUF494 family)
MATTVFDTYSFVKQLKAAGFDEKQAEIQAEAINRALIEFQDKQIQAVASKTDVLGIKAGMAVDLANTKVEIIKWVAGMLVAQAAVVATLVKLL